MAKRTSLTLRSARRTREIQRGIIKSALKKVIVAKRTIRLVMYIYCFIRGIINKKIFFVKGDL